MKGERQMKVSIIGGGGLVGSCVAFALQCGGIVSEISLIDVNADLCKGQSLDLLHGASLAADQRICATGYEAIPQSDLVMITAGLRRKPDESRLDLINRNVELFESILGEVERAGLKPNAIVLVVSNPVDVLTHLATKRLDLPSRQVIGLGTTLDTARFRSLIAAEMNLPPTQVSALILGEHGDSMVPIWSAAQAGGMPLEKYPGWTTARAEALFARTKGSGAEVIKLKGGAGFAVGLSIREVVHAIALDSRRILPVSSLVSGPYGIRDVCISVPTVIGRTGVLAQLEIDIWPKEVSALQHSAQVLKDTINQVQKGSAGASDKPSSQPESSRAETPPPKPVRVTTGAGGGGSALVTRSRVTISGLSQRNGRGGR
jgi:L-lactate dehydrogenase